MYIHDAPKVKRKNFKDLTALNKFLEEKHLFSDDSWDIIQTDETYRGIKATFRFQKNGKLS